MITKKDYPQWFKALRGGDVPGIRRWLAKGRDPNEPIFWDESSCASPPLFLVYEPDATRALLEAGADPNQLEQLPPNPRKDWSYNLSSPLMHAAQAQDPEMLRLLLDAGARIEKGLDSVWQAILSVDGRQGHAAVRLLLDHVKPAALKRNGAPLLCIAAGNSSCKGIIADLVDRGADPNSVDRDSLPLQKAVEQGNSRAVEELLAAGADPNLGVPKAKNEDHRLSAIELARKLRKKKLVELLESGGRPAKPAPASTKTTKVPTLRASWEQFESLLADSHSDLLATLRKPATEATLRRLVSAVHVRISADVRGLFERHNGQEPGPGLFRLEDGSEFRFLGTDEVAAEWRVWRELAEGGEFDDADAVTDDGVRECWWHDGWLPFAGNGLGDFLCFDFSPAKGGDRGQVITLWHERGERSVVFASARELLHHTVGNWSGHD